MSNQLIIRDKYQNLYSNFYRIRFSSSMKIASFQVTIEETDHFKLSNLQPDDQKVLEKELNQTILSKDSPFRKANPDYLLLNYIVYVPQVDKKTDDSIYESDLTFDGNKYHVILKKKEEQTILIDSEEGYMILARLLKKVTQFCKLKRIQGKFFDVNQITDFDGGRISLMKGYTTQVIKQEKLFLQVSPCIKTIRNESVLDIIEQMMYTKQDLNGSDFIGSIIMTSYNKTFYRVERICEEMTPESEFPLADKTNTKYSDYVKSRYKQSKINPNQPMIECTTKRRGVESKVHLIPQLCKPTGETDQMRADFRLQKQIQPVKHAGASQKIDSAIEFIKKLEKDSKEMLKKWSIRLEDKPQKLDMKLIQPGSIRMGNKKKIDIQTSNLDRDTQTEMLMAPFEGKGIDRLQIIYSERSGSNCFQSFQRQLQQSMESLQFKMSCQPMGTAVRNDGDEKSWTDSVDIQAQLVIFILPGQKKKGRHYDGLKIYTIGKVGIPSQVILECTVNNFKGLRVVCNKLLVQIAAKTQGIPYTLSDFPELYSKKPTMVIGIDIFHKKIGKEKKSILAFVSSTHSSYARYHPEYQLMNSDQDVSTHLSLLTKQAIEAFGMANNIAPANIIIYRDGVSKGQFNVVKDSEIPAIKNGIEYFKEKTKNTKLTYIVVNKRVNAQFFPCLKDQNIQNSKSAEAGTLIQSDVTDGEMDFFLVSQKAKQGTATPSHYHVLEFEGYLDKQKEEKHKMMEDLQVFTFKLCFLYFNLTGSIKVPAPVKYAHSLSNFIGNIYSPKDVGSLIEAHANIKSSNILYFI